MKKICFLLLLLSTTVVAQIDDRFNEFDKFTQFCDELKTAEVDGDVAKIDSLLELYPDFRDKSIKSNAKYRYCYNAYLAYLYQIGLSSDAFGYNYERDIKKTADHYMKAFFGNNWKKGLYDDLYDLRRYADDYPHLSYTIGCFLIGLHWGEKRELEKLFKSNSVDTDADGGWCIYNAARKGHKDAALLFARIVTYVDGSKCYMSMYNREYLKNFGEYGNIELAIENYTVAATEGPVEVQLEFASYLYNLANFFCPDPAYYKFSADNNKYIELAAYWYKKAAEQGSPVGMRGYALSCQFGEWHSLSSTPVLKFTTEEAVSWLEKAAALGDSDSMNDLGRIYFSSDVSQAIYWFDKAIGTDNNMFANYNLGRIYDLNEKYRNLPKAFELYNVAAERGYNFANYRVGYFYDKGLVVDVDHKKAAEYYEKADDVFEARIRLSEMYEQGIGVYMDKEKAENYKFNQFTRYYFFPKD